MSRTAMVVLGFVALTLGAVFFIINRAPTPATGSPVLTLVGSPIDPITAHDTDWSATIQIPGAPTQRLSPTPSAGAGGGRGGWGGWVLEREGVRWPVSADKPGALIRVLGDAQRHDSAGSGDRGEDGPGLSDGAIVLKLTRADESVTIRIAPAPLSGRVGLESSNGFAGHAAPALLDLLLDPGPVAWRLTDPFPGLSPASATRLELIASSTSGEASSIEMARLDGRWRVIRPIAARANPTVVDQVLTLLGSYRVERFISGARRTSAPRLAIRISRGSKSGGDAELRTIGFLGDNPIEARLGAPYEVDTVLTGPPPTSFSTAVRSYLATTATDTRPEDVGAIKLQWTSGPERSVERSLDAWVESPSKAPADAEPIDEALRFLSSEPGEPQESFSETDIRPLLRIELLGFDGGPLDVLSVGYNADAILTVRGQNVVWLYGRYRGPALFDLPAFSALKPLTSEPAPAEPDGGFPSK